MNSTYSITSKFQVTIPKEAREKLGISSNDRIKFTTKQNHLVIERVPSMLDVANALASDIKIRGIKPASDAELKNAKHTFYSKKMKWE